MEVPIPEHPVRIALIGAGQRAWKIYRPLFSSLKPWADVVAVCDTVPARADAMAAALGARAFYDIRELATSRPMEAAIVVTPIDSHYAISVYLSSHSVPNQVETSMASTLAQAWAMVAAARQNKVLLRVGENFFRMPIDRIVQKIAASGQIGKIRRIVCYSDHTGYHNNSRWIVFAGQYPQWVQAIEHTIPTVEFRSTPQRVHRRETYRAHFFMFPDNLLVVDHAANIKGFLGRQPRPGLTEWQGESGTIVFQPIRQWEGVAEVRYLAEADRQHTDEDVDHTHPLQVYPVIEEYDGSTWLRSYVDLPTGRTEHTNLFRPALPSEHRNPWYGTPVMEHIVSFCLALRGMAESEFDDNDALMSQMMDVAAQESAHLDGRRLALPLQEDTEADQAISRGLKKTYGIDPLDVDGMLDLSYPKR